MGTYALTGGASGIGAELANQLRSEGNTVITLDIKNADVIADLSTSEGRKLAIEGVLEQTNNRLDGFVPLAGVAAGVGHPAALITSLNYFGTVELVEGLRGALASASGAIVLLCSNSAAMSPHETRLISVLLEGDEANALKVTAEDENGMEYMTGKRALAYWMRRNAMDYGRAGVRMNAVAPGPIATPMTEALFEKPGMKDAVDALLGMTPIDRMGTPNEVVDVIRFLLSDAASYVCGSVLFVDGGYDAATRSDHL